MQPIMFALKEGKGIEKDPFDYTLVMLQVSCQDSVRSPPYVKEMNAKMQSSITSTHTPVILSPSSYR